MDWRRLKEIEHAFLARYPDGFAHPDMVELGKKHKMQKMIEKTRAAFAEENFKRADQVLADMVKLVCQSSMVSVFEKPRYREFIGSLTGIEREMYVNGFYERLHGNHRAGFELMLERMQPGKIARWSLITILPLYFKPQQEVFVKPTTAKKMVAELKWHELQYRPLPDWNFYQGFKDRVEEIKTHLDPSLYPNNAALTGVMMMFA